MKNILVVFILAAFLIFISIGLYSISRTAPLSSPLFQIKRIGETVLFKTKITPESKAVYYTELLKRRMNEIQNLYDTKNFDLIITASLRYSTTAGRLTDTVKQAHLVSMTPEIQEQFRKDSERFDQMAQGYTEKDDRWKFIIDAKNYLTEYSSQLPQ